MSIYGFDTTDEIEYDKAGLPVGIYKAMATAEQPHEKDDVVIGVAVTWEVVEGEHKGRSGKVVYSTMHPTSDQAKNIAKQQLKRLADATNKPISETNPIKGRVCVLDVKEQKKNPEYTEIKRYLPEDFAVDEAPF